MDLLGRGWAYLRKVPAWRRALYLDGALGGIYTVLTGGTVLTGLILWAGGGGFTLGLLSALTTAGGLIVLLLRPLQRRFHSHKGLTVASWIAARAAWVPLAVALVVIASTRPEARGAFVPLTLATVLVASALAGIGNVTWYSWLSQLVPREHRGTFLAQRTQWLSAAALVSLPIVGFILDESHRLSVEWLGFAVVLGLSGFTAAFGLRLFQQVPASLPTEPTDPAQEQRRHHGTISSDRFAWYTGVFQVAVYLSAPFFQAYALQRLNMSFSVLMDLQIVSQVIPILTLGLWGTVVDRFGLRLPLGLCSLFKAAVPLCYLVASPQAWWPVVGVYVLSVLDAGITVANGSTLAHMADGRHGAARIAHLNVLISMTASVTPILAGVIAGQGVIVGVDAFVVLFVLSAVGRGASGVILLLPERPRRRRLFRSDLPVPRPEPG